MFGLAELELAMLDLAVAALTDCGRPVPAEDAVNRYHGDPPVQCCDGNGQLFIFWNPARPDRTGIPQGVGSPPGRAQADLFLRLFRCFPSLNDDGSAPVGFDAASEGLALDLDCLWSGFTAAICAQDGSLAPYLSGFDGLQLIDASPRAVKGGCAGIQLHFLAAWKPWAPDGP